MAVVVDPQPLIDAVQAAVAAQNVAVDVGKKPTVAAGRPWVVMWPDAGAVGDRSMRHRDGFALTVPFHCYGLSVASAMVALRKVRTAMLGMTGQAVAGRAIQMPSHSIPPVLDRDDTADPPLWQFYDEWRIRTT